MLEITLLPGTAMAVGTMLTLLAGTLLLLYMYATRNFSYWRRKGVTCIKPLPFVGNFLNFVLFRKTFGEEVYDIHQRAKDQRFLGIYAFDLPVLFIKDTKLWDNIIRKDFSHFYDHGFSPLAKNDPLISHGPFTKKGKEWKDLRAKLTPAFSSGKLKRFFALMEEKAKHLDHYFDDVAEKGIAKDISNACGEFTTDVVASIGFGIESDALIDSESPFRKVLKNVFTFSHFGTVMSAATFFNAMEKMRRYLGTRLVPEKLEVFLRRSVTENVRHRKETNTVGVRGDFLDLLIELREKGSISEDNGKTTEASPASFKLDEDEFISQAFTFLSAGFETSSTTMIFTLYHLAMEPYVQDELRRRLQETLGNKGEKLTYETLQSVTYLDMIINEALRLHPILPFLDRMCTEPYQIPESDVVIDKGVVVICSLLGIQRDPAYFPDPERFDPERFSEDENRKRPPCTYMGFGDGPRICIGKRLGILQAKLGLAHIILNYKIRACPETPPTMEYGLYSFLLYPKNGVPVVLSRV